MATSVVWDDGEPCTRYSEYAPTQDALPSPPTPTRSRASTLPVPTASATTPAASRGRQSKTLWLLPIAPLTSSAAAGAYALAPTVRGGADSASAAAVSTHGEKYHTSKNLALGLTLCAVFCAVAAATYLAYNRRERAKAKAATAGARPTLKTRGFEDARLEAQHLEEKGEKAGSEQDGQRRTHRKVRYAEDINMAELAMDWDGGGGAQRTDTKERDQEVTESLKASVHGFYQRQDSDSRSRPSTGGSETQSRTRKLI